MISMIAMTPYFLLFNKKCGEMAMQYVGFQAYSQIVHISLH